ncbi:MAG: site-specific integrase, partial [Legionella sp.]
MRMKYQLLPIFDNLNNLHKNHENAVLPNPRFHNDFHYSLSFLKSYTGSLGTFNSYRREAERLLQWSWHIKNATIDELKREDIEEYVHFCQNPPKSWISIKKVPRFIEKDAKRVPNPDWRPFVATISKSSRQNGNTASEEHF